MRYACALPLAMALLVCPLTGFAGDLSDIHDAVRAGDLERVTGLLDADPELVNARAARGEAPLLYAAARRDVALVGLLLSRGADVRQGDARGRTPLHIAALSNDHKLIEALLAAGADVNASDDRGETPLHLAARRFRPAALQALLAAGADVNAQNHRGETALHVLGSAMRVRDAAFEQLLGSLADLLIASGADPGIIASGIPALRAAEAGAPQPQRGGYRTWPEIEQLMADWAADYPAICRLRDLGLSVLGRHIWALNISDNVGVDEDEPEFKYVSTMHGDEWTGNEMCLFFIDCLLTDYGSDPQITNLIDEIDIWVVPVMNPDGYVAVSRYNAHGVDLNRNFPEWVHGDENTTDGKEPETAAIMNWTFEHSFTLSANMHTGAVVANYPFDNDGVGSTYSHTPDDDLFIWICQEYSRHNQPMWDSPYFWHGITNGADWYSISGGMQDWHYRYMGGNEVTLELSGYKIPPYAQIPQFWEDNRQAMLAYMATCLTGVRGIVTDADGGTPLAAAVTVVGRDHQTYTDPDIGDYHRMLLPGSYELRVEAEGYDPVTMPAVVSNGPAARLDVALGPPTQLLYPNGGETLAAGTPIDVTWQGNPETQFHVQYSPNFGQSATSADGFESGTLGPGYTTGGAAGWFVTDLTAHTGTYAARSGKITHTQQSWMARSGGGGAVSFWYTLSTEYLDDYFNFYIDGVRVLHRAGVVYWDYYSAILPPGPHVLKWEYIKDHSGDGGQDAVLIDDLFLPADLTAWIDIAALTAPGQTSVTWTPTESGEDYKVRVRACYGGDTYGAWDESDATFAVVEGAFQPGDLNCDGVIDAFDVDPFVCALSAACDYEAQYPDCDVMLADVDGSGHVDGFDIDPFVDLLTAG